MKRREFLHGAVAAGLVAGFPVIHADRAGAAPRQTAAGSGASSSQGFSWADAEQHAPNPSLFESRGTATVQFGSQFAAPGAPPKIAHLYGILRYRDKLESVRSYDLYFSPSLAIWRLRRLEDGRAAEAEYPSSGEYPSSAQYLGGFHYPNCRPDLGTGFRSHYPPGQGYHATDRVFMPAMGLHPAFMHDASDLDFNENTAVRTNYGCENDHYSNPWPIDNYQGAGSGDGDIPEIVNEPMWTSATQTLFSVSLPWPWVYYEGVLDPASPRFQDDYNNYSPPLSESRREFIQQQVTSALRNLRLENQIRILPDGTVMMTHMWTDLAGRPWIPHATDGYWLAPDSAPNGRVFYFDTVKNDYVEPFAGGGGGINLGTGNGWVGYFVDQVRLNFGIGFYYDKSAGGIAIFPADDWPNSPAVIHTDYWTSIAPYGRAFRQMFMTIGTKEDMQERAGVLNDYTRVLSLNPTSG